MPPEDDADDLPEADSEDDGIAPLPPDPGDLRAARNCDGDGLGLELDLPCGLRQCPRAYVREDETLCWQILGWYTQRERFGVWPYPGPPGKQPAWVVDAFGVVASGHAKGVEWRQRKEAERVRAEAKGATSGGYGV